MTRQRHVSDAERRARLVRRHHLDGTAGDLPTVVADLVAVHSSDPTTPYLALRARLPGFRTADLDRALYRERCLWRLHGMRRTLFVVPTSTALVVDAACARDVARSERTKVERWVAEALGADDPRPWLAAVADRTCAVLADGNPRRTQDLTTLVDGLGLQLTVGSGRWTATAPLSSRLLFLLALEGRVARAQPAGSWLSSQYHWVDAESWFGEDSLRDREPLGQPTSRAVLARAWLRSHGPGTANDLRWWAGWTAKATAAALTAVRAVAVGLSGGEAGWVLPDDVDPAAEAAPGVALLPALDPTVMGWKARAWYLGEHGPQLFDRNGNAGPTVWLDGRVVGGWALRPGGEVVTQLLEDVGAEASGRVDAEAAALTRWLQGTSPIPRFRTPLERRLAG